ncbi:ribbon-helix-helix domain-containing protein [Paenalcaligenes niemegkensis]|uniref:ribbon-helix-helix domain-containing protein n=1 Tax=Paenalcaligenes niemegkensis TaxID=2895469 RepID=UPI001EE91E8E|nr:ribbon-helix-helix domain-containing protein [Paenalcaligenes niemegkensis]MCQ9617072.1 ribbon-helix-helix domain-containing protein [Paenalcaligenes niemegkensis]
MCHIYSHADPIMYESRSRSVRISKVVTSIKLENLFWDTLAELATEGNVTTNELIATLHDEVFAFRGETSNFASFLRVTCMRYLELRTQSHQHVQYALRKPAKIIQKAPCAS